MPDETPDPLARLTERSQEYAALWRSAIERNAAGTYKPEDWLNDVNRAWVMAAEDAARMFATVVDGVAARRTSEAPPEDDPSASR